jgi:hypothetical protein
MGKHVQVKCRLNVTFSLKMSVTQIYADVRPDLEFFVTSLIGLFKFQVGPSSFSSLTALLR